jgi:hypothetical protein
MLLKKITFLLYGKNRISVNAEPLIGTSLAPLFIGLPPSDASLSPRTGNFRFPTPSRSIPQTQEKNALHRHPRPCRIFMIFP